MALKLIGAAAGMTIGTELILGVNREIVPMTMSREGIIPPGTIVSRKAELKKGNMAGGHIETIRLQQVFGT